MHRAPTSIEAGLRNSVVHIVGELRRLQLFTGGVVCTRRLPDNSLLHCSCPVAAALVYQLLASADPGSPFFESRVLDFFTGPEKRALASTVAGLRWRLRTYIASEQNSDGTWSFFGRESSSGLDLATSACASTVLRPGASRPPNFLSRLKDGNQPSLYDLAHVLRSHALSGFDDSELTNQIARLISASADLPAYTLQILASAISKSSIADLHDLTASVTAQLKTFKSTTRLEKASIISGLLDLGIGSSQYAGFLQTAMQDAISPFYWPHEAFASQDVGSTAVTLALTLANVISIGSQSTEIWM
jgi:hypothetical protein